MTATTWVVDAQQADARARPDPRSRRLLIGDRARSARSSSRRAERFGTLTTLTLPGRWPARRRSRTLGCITSWNGVATPRHLVENRRTPCGPRERTPTTSRNDRAVVGRSRESLASTSASRPSGSGIRDEERGWRRLEQPDLMIRYLRTVRQPYFRGRTTIRRSSTVAVGALEPCATSRRARWRSTSAGRPGRPPPERRTWPAVARQHRHPGPVHAWA
jgi:hypothetical protein